MRFDRSKSRVCAHCGQPFLCRANERPNRFLRRLFCGRACSSKSRAAIMSETLEKHSRLNLLTGCVEWTAYRDPKGYGRISHANSTEWLAHRIAYTLKVGPIPAGLGVLHRCDNPPCVNPDHLFLGTDADNAADRVAKGRGPIGERNVCAKLTEQDVLNILQDTRSHAAVGRDYGVCGTTISSIRSGRLWKHIRRAA